MPGFGVRARGRVFLPRVRLGDRPPRQAHEWVRTRSRGHPEPGAQRPVTFRDEVSEALEQRVTRASGARRGGSAGPSAATATRAQRAASAAGRLYSTYKRANSTFTVHTGVQVYFSDPRITLAARHQENTNGVQLQDYCQGAGLRALREGDLDTIPDALNGRPRETLGWVMTAEQFAELVAMTG